MKNWKKKAKSLLALLLCASICVTSLPLQGFAQETPVTDDLILQPRQDFDKDPVIVGESTLERDAYTKHFTTSDRSYVAAVYEEPVHFQKEEEWENIDNRLELKEDGESGPVYTNKASDVGVQFVKTSGDDALVRVAWNGDSISWGLKASGSSVPSEPEPPVSQADPASSEATGSADESSPESDMPTSSAVSSAQSEANGAQPKATARTLPEETEEGSSSSESGLSSEDSVPPSSSEAESNSQPVPEEPKQPVPVRPSEFQVDPPEEPISLFSDVNPEELTNSAEIEAYNRQKTAVTNLTSSGKYEEILPGIDLQYILHSNSIKENIIVKNREAVSLLPLSFTIDHTGLSIRKEEDGSLSLYKEEEPEKAIFTFLAPFMSDANGVTSYGVEYQISKGETEGQSVLTVLPDMDWLNDAERVFPLIIDPITKTETSSNIPIKEAFVTQADPYTNFGNVEFMTTGSTKTGKKTRSLIQFDNLPNLNNRATIRRAYLRLTTFDTEGAGLAYYPPLRNPYQDGKTVQVNAYEMEHSWDAHAVTWSHLWSGAENAYYDNNALDYARVDKHAQHRWDITKAVKGWYRDPDENYGIMLTNDNEASTDERIFFATSDWALVNEKEEYKKQYYPIVELLYCNNTGLEDFWSYHSQSVGRAGTGSVNDYTGKLVFVHDDTATPGSRMPVVVSHVYNSTQDEWNFTHNPKDFGKNESYDAFPRTGMGWKLNLHQTLVEVDPSMGLTEEYKYIFTDGDGTEHYFYEKDGKIIDEDGLGMEVKTGREAKMVELKDGSKLDFDSYGRLEIITDKNGNVMEIEWTYRSNQWVITGVSDAAGNHISFEIDWTNIMLMSMTDQAGRKTSFHYDRDNSYAYRYLDSITYPDGTTTNFTYNKSNGYDKYQLSGVENADGYKVNYAYNNRKQVTSVKETSGSSTGQELRISYGDDNTTTFRTSGRDDIIGNSDDILETYTFNFDGQTKSISSELADGTHLGGSNYEYTSPSGKTGDQKQNRIKTGSTVGKNVVNLLRNHNAEFDTSDWIKDEKGGVASLSVSDDEYMGYKSLKIEKQQTDTKRNVYWLQQLNTLENGKTYTFSAYVKSNSNSEGSVYLQAMNMVGEEYVEVNSEPAVSNDGSEWERLSVTFTVPEERTYPWTWVYLMFDSTEAGSAVFDCMQLEESDTVNPYNFVENASFEQNSSGIPDFWTESYIQHDENGYASGQKFGQAVTIDGEPENYPGMWQLCHVTATEKDTFIISGWGKANSLPSTKEDATFGLPVVIKYSDGFQRKIECSFNFDTTSWQYVSKAFTLDDGEHWGRTPVSIYVYVDYMHNMNRAYFDNIQLIKEDVPTYDYDNKGNLVSATQMEQDSQFAYSNDNLSKIMDAKGNFTYYNYDRSTENVTVARNRQGIEYNYSYNSYGNVTGVQAQGNPNAKDPLTIDDYYIRNKRSGLYIDVSGSSSTYGTPVIQYDAHRESNQRFYILGAQSGEDGYFCMIRARHADHMGFAPKDSSSDDGAKIVTQSETGIPASQWYLQYNEDDGSYSFKNKATGKYLDLESDSNERLVNLVQKEKDSNAPSQRWFLELANPTGGKMTSSATYTENGAFLDTVTDNRGYQSKYEYNQNTGTLSNLISNAGLDSARTTNYTYDPNTDQLLSVSQKNGSQTITNSYTYDQDKLTSLTHNGFSYNFLYDQWGNRTQTKVGSQTLMTDTFTNGNGKLLKSTYGNGDWIDYVYDKQERQTQKKYNGILGFEWTYNNSGQVAKIKDHINGVDYAYSYDSLGRLLQSKGSDGTRFQYKYDIYSQVTDAEYRIGNATLGVRPKFSVTGLTTELKNLFGGSEQNALYYDYDVLGRITKVRLYDYAKDGYLNEQSYEYLSPEEGKTSTLVSKYKVGSTAYTYDYDAFGNITKVYENGVEKASYQYDKLNQLVRENNKYTNKTILYSYDIGGNLSDTKWTHYTTSDPINVPTANLNDYSYGDANWKDKLTSFNGQAITYDEIGNPLSYRDGWNFTWKNGRQLATATGNGYTISYQYNADGLRTEKTVNGKTTKYYYNNNQLLGEEKEGSGLYYYYDNNGQAIGVRYNDVSYYMLCNLQGDVVALTDVSGTEVVKYVYNSWGKLESITGTLASTLGKDNSIRYRGYYHDEETGLYYLQSRYYDPETCRFINADSSDVVSKSLESAKQDKNLFAYCDNNPISRYDDGGEFWHLVVGAVAGAVCGAIGQVVENALTGKNLSDGLVKATLTGAASGVVAATGVGLVGSIAWNAAIGGTGEVLDRAVQRGGLDKLTAEDGKAMVISTIQGGIAGGIGGSGFGGNYLNSVSRQVNRRVSNTFSHQGARAAISEARNAASWYAKTTYKTISGGIARGILKPTVAVVGGRTVYYNSISSYEFYERFIQNR